jgi:hypothetical protein
LISGHNTFEPIGHQGITGHLEGGKWGTNQGRESMTLVSQGSFYFCKSELRNTVTSTNKNCKAPGFPLANLFKQNPYEVLSE